MGRLRKRQKKWKKLIEALAITLMKVMARSSMSFSSKHQQKLMLRYGPRDRSGAAVSAKS